MLNNYPGYGMFELTANIHIVDQCGAPSLTVGQVTNIDSDYTHQATFDLPAMHFEPVVCRSLATYSCQYLGGPYNGNLNLCEFSKSYAGNLHAFGSFDVTTGAYRFSTNDKNTFKQGVYRFRVTTTVGATVSTMDFTMTLHEVCEPYELVIQYQPQLETYYIVGEEQVTIFTYEL
jgi:hypothetical protein